MENKQPINPFNQPLADNSTANTTNPVVAGLSDAASPGNGNSSTTVKGTDSSVTGKNSKDSVNQGSNEADKSSSNNQNYNSPSRRSWLLFGITCFLLMLIYIYNSGHANKGLRTKEKLSKELKELNSESISLESQITNASTQSALTQRLEGTGLKEITTPPTKLVKKKKDE
ncbi:MAG: hypothetical protein RLZZ252_860 [Bacteroidota bacterium]|jgi:hypothetical protein